MYCVAVYSCKKQTPKKAYSVSIGSGYASTQSNPGYRMVCFSFWRENGYTTKQFLATENKWRAEGGGIADRGVAGPRGTGVPLFPASLVEAGWA